MHDNNNNNDFITIPSGDLHANDNPGYITIRSLKGCTFRKVPYNPITLLPLPSPQQRGDQPNRKGFFEA